MSLLVKIVISACLIGAISEVSRRSSTLAAFLAALPLVSLLSMLWMYHDTHDVGKIAEFSWSVFWYVLPSLILFVLLPLLLKEGRLSFYPALLLSSLATVVGFLILKLILRRWGIEL